VAEIAFGTYSCHSPLKPLVDMALDRGCRLFDTAPNYRRGVAQTELREALVKAPPVRIFSKIGFFSETQALEFFQRGLIDDNEVTLGHSLNPNYIKYQVLENLNALGVSSLDTLFLHNPERCLASKSAQEFFLGLRKAFEVLEDFCDKGAIKRYGIATWSGFELSELTIERLASLAQEVTPNHRFRAIQLPLSLVKTKVVSKYLEGQGPLWEASSEGIEVYGSSPLHGGQLPPLINQALCERIDASLTPAQACLLFAKSIPGVQAIFTSPSSVEQVNQSFEISQRKEISEDQIRDLLTLLQQTA